MIQPIEEAIDAQDSKKKKSNLENKLINLDKNIQANTFALLIIENNRAKYNMLRKVQSNTNDRCDFGEYLDALSTIAYFITLDRFDYTEHNILCDLLECGINLIKKYDGNLNGCDNTAAVATYNELDQWRRN